MLVIWYVPWPTVGPITLIFYALWTVVGSISEDDKCDMVSILAQDVGPTLEQLAKLHWDIIR